MIRTRTLSFISAGICGTVAALVIVIAQPFAGTRTKVVRGNSGSTAFASQVSKTSGLEPREIYERDAHGVVAIRASSRGESSEARSPFGTESSGESTDTGSGVVLSSTGLILTNEHVVEGASTISVSLDGEDGRTRRARVVSSDRSSDLALLQIDATGLTLHPLSLESSGSTSIGDPAYAIGNPFGLNWTLTTGIISAVNREIKAPDGTPISHALQTDAALNPGNSGGPLIDESGKVIGLNSQIISGSSTSTSQGGSSGVGFAISTSTIRAFLARSGTSV